MDGSEMTVRECVALSGLTRAQIYNLIVNGRIVVQKFGHVYVVNRKSMVDYVIQAAFEKQFIAAMKQFDPILDISTSFETPTEAAGDFPVDDDLLSGRVVNEILR